ncbi:MAG: sulfotransferase [Microthrixaceae bacterium]|nr:sulfotransferase [Microthrixaceae bacterium]
MWQPPERTAAASAAIAAADQDRLARPDRYLLDADHLASVAARRDGDTERFAAGWREGLERYVESASEDGRLNAFGMAMAARTAVSRLRSGVALSRFREANPNVADRPPTPPIFITGGWRSGTTFLFRLLASDPHLRAPLPAELAEPMSMASLSGEERERRIDASAAAHDMLHVLNPTLRAIHDSGARLPEECGLAMGADLRSWSLSATTRLESYSEWLAGQDLGPSYRDYASVLGVLGDGDDRRWVLKAPPHLAELGALAQAFPGAVVVILHRDIVETIASGASLFAVFRSTYSDDVDPRDVGRFQSDQTELWMRRAHELRTSALASTITMLDVDYGDLVSDPAGTLDRVYAAADREPPADLEAFVADFNAAHPRHAQGTHRYSPEDFGLNPAELRERFAEFAR